MAVAQPTRDCAANRLSLSNGVVQLTARHKQIFFPLVNFFRSTSAFVFKNRLFLESAFKAVVISR